MKINYINKNEIDNLYLHDSIFYGYQYNYDERIISFSCENKLLRQYRTEKSARYRQV